MLFGTPPLFSKNLHPLCPAASNSGRLPVVSRPRIVLRDHFIGAAAAGDRLEERALVADLLGKRRRRYRALARHSNARG